MITPHDLAQSLDLPKRAVALVLAGGRGSRLKSLTDDRAKPAVYFGGKFRIVDFALSNCVNSGIRQIGIHSEYTDGRDMPRLLIRSVEFEGPYYDRWPSAAYANIFGAAKGPGL